MNSKLHIGSARREFDSLILEVEPWEADNFLESFKPGEFEISPVSKKRSLNANNYCWLLCGKIAAKLGIRDVDVYRDAVLDVGYYAAFTMHPQEVDSFTVSWGKLGIGWQTAQVDYEQDGNLVTVFAYYGSSTYTRQEMKRLLDWLVQEAQQLGIDMEDPAKIQQMLDYWDKEIKKRGI